VFDDFIEMEAQILRVIDWQLLQYPVFEFINLFLAHGCLFEADLVLQQQRPDTKAGSTTAHNMRKYAEFFTDFSIQESKLIKCEPLPLACAILAVTRKHLNLEVIWAEEMTLLTTLQLAHFKDIFLYIDQRYSTNFPESVAHQAKQVCGRQKLEPLLAQQTDKKQKSAENSSSAKASGSATTQPNTHCINSGASVQTSKYGTFSSQKAFYDCFKNSSVKKESECDRSALEMFDKENKNARANIQAHLSHLISVNTSTSKQQLGKSQVSQVSQAQAFKQTQPNRASFKQERDKKNLTTSSSSLVVTNPSAFEKT